MQHKALKIMIIILCVLVIGVISGIVYLCVLNHQMNVQTSNLNPNNQINTYDFSNQINQAISPNITITENMINLNEVAEEQSKIIPDYNLQFELPVEGATGYAAIELNIRKEANSSASLVKN